MLIGAFSACLASSSVSDPVKIIFLLDRRKMVELLVWVGLVITSESLILLIVCLVSIHLIFLIYKFTWVETFFFLIQLKKKKKREKEEVAIYIAIKVTQDERNIKDENPIQLLDAINS